MYSATNNNNNLEKSSKAEGFVTHFFEETNVTTKNLNPDHNVKSFITFPNNPNNGSLIKNLKTETENKSIMKILPSATTTKSSINNNCTVIGCEKCQESIDICEQCSQSEGFLPTPENNKCKCEPSRYPFNNVCKLCKETQPGCVECTEAEHCLKCNTTQNYLPKPDDDTKKCFCKNGYGKSLIEPYAGCEPCNFYVEGCVRCVNLGSCEACSTELHYQPKPNSTKYCICQNGYHMDRKTSPVECYKCSHWVNHCDTCTVDYHFDERNDKVIERIVKVEETEGVLEAVKKEQGFEKNEVKASSDTNSNNNNNKITEIVNCSKCTNNFIPKQEQQEQFQITKEFIHNYHLQQQEQNILSSSSYETTSFASSTFSECICPKPKEIINNICCEPSTNDQTLLIIIIVTGCVLVICGLIIFIKKKLSKQRSDSQKSLIPRAEDPTIIVPRIDERICYNVRAIGEKVYEPYKWEIKGNQTEQQDTSSALVIDSSKESININETIKTLDKQISEQEQQLKEHKQLKQLKQHDDNQLLEKEDNFFTNIDDAGAQLVKEYIIKTKEKKEEIIESTKMKVEKEEKEKNSKE